MGQFVGAIEGMARGLPRARLPGRVAATSRSTTRPTARPILPTPTIGARRPDRRLRASASASRFTQAGDAHRADRRDHGRARRSRSICARSLGREDGAPPPVDLAAERRNGDFVRGQIAAGRVAACHDLSDGGLLVGLAEMAMAGGIGAAVDAARRALRRTPSSFGEDQAPLSARRPSDADALLAARPARPACRRRGSARPAATR